MHIATLHQTAISAHIYTGPVKTPCTHRFSTSDNSLSSTSDPPPIPVSFLIRMANFAVQHLFIHPSQHSVSLVVPDFTEWLFKKISDGICFGELTATGKHIPVKINGRRLPQGITESDVICMNIFILAEIPAGFPFGRKSGRNVNFHGSEHRSEILGPCFSHKFPETRRQQRYSEYPRFL